MQMIENKGTYSADKQNYKKTITISIVFFTSIIGLEIFILQKQTNINTDLYLLWFSIAVAFSSLFIGIIIRLKWILLFFMILILSFFLSFMFIPRYGLYGADANYDYNLIKLINEFGWNINLDFLAPWPMIHLFIDITSNIMNISLLDGSRFLPSITSTILLFFLFCLGKRMNRNYISSIIYIFLFSTIIYRSFFHSIPLRENFGYLFLFAGLSCQLASIEVKDTRLKFLSIFFGLILIVSHHFTSLIYSTFLISVTISQYIFNFIKKNNYLTERYSNNMRYSLLIMVSTFYYWILVNKYFFNLIINSATSFMSFGEVVKRSYFVSIYPNPPETFLMMHSPRLTFFLTMLLLIIYIYKYFNNLSQYDYSIVLFVFIIGVVWLFSNYGMIKIDIYPERIQLFAWIFLLILLSKILLEFMDLRGFLSIEKLIAVLFIISFITMNFTQIYPYIYDPDIQPFYDYGQVRGYHLEEEYVSTEWFSVHTDPNIDKKFIQSDRTISDLLITRGNKIVTDEGFFRQNDSYELYDTDWAIIRMEMFKRIAGTARDNPKIKNPLNLTRNAYNMINQQMIKIYENCEVDIYGNPSLSN